MPEFVIKSYVLTIDGKEVGEKMYPISTIIRALERYEEKHNGIISSLNGTTTVKEIVEGTIKKE